jgi:nucleoside 2-deoxyribosyltransferase
VYLAGPFFTIADRWFVSLIYDALHDLGAEVFSPMHDVGLGGKEVAKADLNGLKRSNSVLALLERGDVGTAFEAGWATRGQKPVVVYLEVGPDSEGMKMLSGTGAYIYSDLSSALYWAVWTGMGLKPTL